MPWSYNRLWKLLIDRNLKKTDLLSVAKINRKTLANMGKNETVSMDALGKICAALNCRIEDIIEFVPEKQDEPKSE